MEIKIFVNNPWQENTVVLYDRTGEAVIIDCGCFSGEEERRLQDFLSQKKLKPVALLDTHLHIDHIFGNNFIKNTYGLSAQASNEDNFLVENAVEYAAMLGVTGITPPPAVRCAKACPRRNCLSFQTTPPMCGSIWTLRACRCITAPGQKVPRRTLP